MTKQEQRHEIIITLIKQDFGTNSVVRIANGIMAEMYGNDWESKPEVEYIPGCGNFNNYGAKYGTGIVRPVAESKHE